MGRIKGIQVVLYDKKKIGETPFGEALYEDIEILVDDVLIAPVSSLELVNQLNIEGKKEVYMLGIPKGDANNWQDKKVNFFGRDFKTFGAVEEGIEGNIPLKWHKKIMVDRYE